jgi:hypothetical protein
MKNKPDPDTLTVLAEAGFLESSQKIVIYDWRICRNQNSTQLRYKINT